MATPATITAIRTTITMKTEEQAAGISPIAICGKMLQYGIWGRSVAAKRINSPRETDLSATQLPRPV